MRREIRVRRVYGQSLPPCMLFFIFLVSVGADREDGLPPRLQAGRQRRGRARFPLEPFHAFVGEPEPPVPHVRRSNR
jgi:hypothetical protein